MQCHYYDSGRCASCTLIRTPYDEQVAGKQAAVEALLPAMAWLPPVTSPQEGFRNKAKMTVAGTVEAPTLGILDPVGRGVDLRTCGLHAPGLKAVLPVLAESVSLAGLRPYDVAERRGELKYLLVTESPDHELMVRLVLRSTEALARIRKHLPWLLDRLVGEPVVSVNVQPEHKAVLEGEREIVLTEHQTLRMRLDGLDLHLRPQSFFQTNTAVAVELYRQARSWVDEIGPATVWDLYSGVGGFALHLAAPGRMVTGVEVSAEAVASAALTAREAGLDHVRFLAGDATAFALGEADRPDVVVVNPPRRGIGAELSGWLEGSGVRSVVYSSCNAVSLAGDLARMPSLRPVRGRLLDMFPNTDHYEVLVQLERV